MTKSTYSLLPYNSHLRRFKTTHPKHIPRNVGKACILRVPCPNRRLLVEGRQQVHSSREQLQQSLTLPFTSGKSRGKTGKILIPPVGKRLSRSSRAGLQFPVTRFHRKCGPTMLGRGSLLRFLVSFSLPAIFLLNMFFYSISCRCH